MDTQYQKAYYPNPCGFTLHHTAGFSAEASTLRYPHRNDVLMLICFLQGTGSVMVEGAHYDVNAGDMILLHPGELYRCTVHGQTFHERIVVHIRCSSANDFPRGSEALLSPLLGRPKGTGNLIPAQLLRENGMDELVQALLRHSQARQDVDNVLAMCRLLELLAQLNRLALPRETAEPAQRHPLMDAVLSYIHTHFQEDITVDSIAAACSIHKSYLSHLFKAYMGTSVWNYVILRRINLFNEQLQKNQSVEQTCYAVGFQNYANFYRLYKKHKGLTPMQYKKQLLSAHHSTAQNKTDREG